MPLPPVITWANVILIANAVLLVQPGHLAWISFRAKPKAVAPTIDLFHNLLSSDFRTGLLYEGT